MFLHNPEAPPRAEDNVGYESAGSKAASSVSKEHSSEDIQEEYSRYGFLYHRDNANRHGHRDREEYFPEHPDHTEERPRQRKRTVVMKTLTRNGKVTLTSTSHPHGVGEAGSLTPGKPAETVARAS